MKASRCIASFLIVGALCCGAADEAKSSFKFKVAADFKSCPDGHKALKDIPIQWGQVGLLCKKPSEYNEEDRKLAEKVAKGEIVLGGDLLPPDPPATRIVCQKCGFQYYPSDLPEDSPRFDTWNKTGRKPDDFKISFSKTLLHFPLLQPVEGSLQYSQSLDAKGKVVKNESVSFRTPLKIDPVLEAAWKWMRENGRDPKSLKRNTDASTNYTYDYTDNYVSLMVQDDSYWNQGQIQVYLWLSPAEARKPIRISEELQLGADPFAPQEKSSRKVPSTQDPCVDAPNVPAQEHLK